MSRVHIILALMRVCMLLKVGAFVVSLKTLPAATSAVALQIIVQATKDRPLISPNNYSTIHSSYQHTISS